AARWSPSPVTTCPTWTCRRNGPPRYVLPCKEWSTERIRVFQPHPRLQRTRCAGRCERARRGDIHIRDCRPNKALQQTPAACAGSGFKLPRRRGLLNFGVRRRREAMALSKMSASDRGIIFECLTAAARGPFFNDADLRILVGLDRSELLGIVARIPRLDDSEPNVRRAIGYTLLNLLMYPHGKNAEWSNWISVNRATVEQVDARWAALLPPIVYESFQVFGPACFGGRSYRVVEYRVRGGGGGCGCEVWSSGRWLCPRDGPGGNEIMA